MYLLYGAATGCGDCTVMGSEISVLVRDLAASV